MFGLAFLRQISVTSDLYRKGCRVCLVKGTRICNPHDPELQAPLRRETPGQGRVGQEVLRSLCLHSPHRRSVGTSVLKQKVITYDQSLGCTALGFCPVK